MPPLQLILTNDADEVRRLVEQGFCPVECSIGGQSFVDDLAMDHHGELAHLESVALRAWRDHFAARRHDPRFVGVGAGDADMTFAIGALTGLLPHPSRVADPPRWQRDAASLVALIALLDTDPIGVELLQQEAADPYLVWRALAGDARTSDEATAAVFLWQSILTTPSPTLEALASGARQRELERRERAAETLARARTFGPLLLIEDTTLWGFDVWYGRLPNTCAERADAWRHPLILTTHPDTHQATLGCPNAAVAEDLFGPGGLLNVFPHLQPPGWGGRPTIGGSPRGLALTPEQFEAAALAIAAIAARSA